MIDRLPLPFLYIKWVGILLPPGPEPFHHEAPSTFHGPLNSMESKTLLDRQQEAFTKYINHYDEWNKRHGVSQLPSVRYHESRSESQAKSPGTPWFLGIPLQVLDLLFKALALMSFGHSDLTHLLTVMMLVEEEHDEEGWIAGVDRLSNRLNNVLITGGLLLATTAAFITTTPPKDAMINYTVRGPYLCLLAAFSLLIGGVIVGSASVVVMSKVRPSWVMQVMFAERFHVWGFMLLLAYPFLSIGIATLFIAFGLFSGIWVARDAGIQGACAIVLLLPLSMGGLFVYMWARTAIKQVPWGDSCNSKELLSNGTNSPPEAIV
ncbi:hypothetical protein DL96DRAFT_638701 [Flagelloscypha sp. PMI_526]|nr:hypothetical protein DL96DRAFT_638701 [Flagelloscypha sp. PMI_526]